MFKWFKKKELETILELEEKIKEHEQAILFAEGKLSDAVKIANAKRVVKCDHKGCIDWKAGTCELPEIVLGWNGSTVICKELTVNIADDMVNDNPIVKFKFVEKV